MEAGDIQELCQLGQEQLQRMQYLHAEQTLAAAEKLAWDGRDFDAMARLYMPLQEAPRQRRQRCGEGTIQLDFLARGPSEKIDGRSIVEHFRHGQFLIAGWGSIQPAIDARREQAKLGLYVDVLLGAVYPVEAGRIVAIVPTEDAALPPPQPTPVDTLIRQPAVRCLVLAEAELPPPTYGAVMAIWERLHAPFLAAADSTADPIRRIEAYRKTIRVDYACELAHQGISAAARQLCNMGSRL